MALAQWDAGRFTDDLVKLADPGNHGFAGRPAGTGCGTAEEYQRYRFWEWLHRMIVDRADRHRPW